MLVAALRRISRAARMVVSVSTLGVVRRRRVWRAAAVAEARRMATRWDSAAARSARRERASSLLRMSMTLGTGISSSEAIWATELASSRKSVMTSLKRARRSASCSASGVEVEVGVGMGWSGK
jgi:hypothetical protein